MSKGHNITIAGNLLAFCPATGRAMNIEIELGAIHFTGRVKQADGTVRDEPIADAWTMPDAHDQWGAVLQNLGNCAQEVLGGGSSEDGEQGIEEIPPGATVGLASKTENIRLESTAMGTCRLPTGRPGRMWVSHLVKPDGESVWVGTIQTSTEQDGESEMQQAMQLTEELLAHFSSQAMAQRAGSVH